MRNSSTSNSRRARSTTANLRPGLSAVKSSHYIPCDYGRKCNHKFAGVTTYYKHVEKYHFEEREARTAAKDKEREKLRMEEVESRTQRAANIEKEHIDSLAQYQEDPAAYFPRNPEANQPPARKEFFQWKVRRSIDLDDIQSDEDIEDEEDPVQYRDIPGTLPNLVRRLNLQTTYLSASDGESGSENDGQASAAKQSRGHEHTKLSNPASGYQHWEEFFVTKRVINKDVGNQERWGDVADDKKLFDLTGMDKTRGPFSPFQSASEFKKARWLIRHRASCEMITDGFNEGIMNCSCSCACGNDKVFILLNAPQRSENVN